MKYGLGIGLGLFSIDHYPVNLIGMLVLFIFTTLYIKDSDCKSWDWGSKWVYIPLLTFLGIAILRLAIYHSVNEVATVSFFLIAIALYLISRKMGREIVKVLIPFLIIEVACIVVMALINRGEIASGFIGQYNRAVGFMVYIALLNQGRYQWILVGIATLAIILTGALEGLIIIAALGVVILIRKDWGKRLWVPLALITVFLLPALFMGDIKNLYSPGVEHLYMDNVEVNTFLNGRVIVYKEAIENISILGHGYVNSLFNASTVHNVPLIVFDQLGILAGIAWIVITGYCLIKTKWKYLWIAIIVMGLFDHFVWTGLAPLYFVAVGLTTSESTNDYIFKE
jgi:hypothetical protein